MEKLTQLVVENPMDIVIAHKRTIKAGELLRLSVAVQTAFTTAVSEVARVILDKAGSSLFAIYVKTRSDTHTLVATFNFENNAGRYIDESEFSFAKKLVHDFTISQYVEAPFIEMSLNLPRSLRLSGIAISEAIKYFRVSQPGSFYEEIKNQKTALSREAAVTGEELLKFKEINEKKNEFLAIASHELKTPLAIIKGFTTLAIMASGKESPQMKEYLMKIDLQATKLNNLIIQLLDVSKIEAGQLEFSWEETSINQYLLRELESIKMVLPHNEIVIELLQDVVIKIDSMKMEQVLSNLFNNASKYAEKHTVIHFSSKVLPGNIIRFSVKDQGIGMNEAAKLKVFDKFYREETVAKKYSGLGMGLYITSKIIAEHGGKIWIDSVPGQGSTFHFSLPYINAV